MKGAGRVCPETLPETGNPDHGIAGRLEFHINMMTLACSLYLFALVDL